MRFDDLDSPFAKRALEVAAVGRHTIAFFGDGTLAAFRILAGSVGVEVVANSADITVEVPLIPEWMKDGFGGEKHEHVMERIEKCGEDWMPMDTLAANLLEAGTRYYSLTVPEIRRIIGVALTIANLAGAKSVCAAHMAEALQYYVPEEGLE